MARHHAPRQHRSRPALIKQVKGETQILCPFCQPPHPISPMESSCGTILKLEAQQRMFTSVACALCGQSHGTLLKRGERYIHDYDCKPGTRIYTVPPPRSRLAAIVYRMPTAFHRFLAKRFGVVPVKFKAGAGWDRPQVVGIEMTDG